MTGISVRAAEGTELTHEQGDHNHAIRIDQIAHGLALGDVVRLTGGPLAAVAAIADSEANLAQAIVIAVISADEIWVRLEPGKVEWPSHGFTADVWAWLSQVSAGEATETEPGNGWRQRLFRAVDSDHVLWYGNPLIAELI